LPVGAVRLPGSGRWPGVAPRAASLSVPAAVRACWAGRLGVTIGSGVSAWAGAGDQRRSLGECGSGLSAAAYVLGPGWQRAGAW